MGGFYKKRALPVAMVFTMVLGTLTGIGAKEAVYAASYEEGEHSQWDMYIGENGKIGREAEGFDGIKAVTYFFNTAVVEGRQVINLLATDTQTAPEGWTLKYNTTTKTLTMNGFNYVSPNGIGWVDGGINIEVLGGTTNTINMQGAEITDNVLMVCDGKLRIYGNGTINFKTSYAANKALEDDRFYCAVQMDAPKGVKTYAEIADTVTVNTDHEPLYTEGFGIWGKRYTDEPDGVHEWWDLMEDSSAEYYYGDWMREIPDESKRVTYWKTAVVGKKGTPHSEKTERLWTSGDPWSKPKANPDSHSAVQDWTLKYENSNHTLTFWNFEYNKIGTNGDYGEADSGADFWVTGDIVLNLIGTSKFTNSYKGSTEPGIWIEGKMDVTGEGILEAIATDSSSDNVVANGVGYEDVSMISVDNDTTDNEVSELMAEAEKDISGDSDIMLDMTNAANNSRVINQAAKSVKNGEKAVLKVADSTSWVIKANSVKGKTIPKNFKLGTKITKSKSSKVEKAFGKNTQVYDLTIGYKGKFGFTADLVTRIDGALGENAQLYKYSGGKYVAVGKLTPVDGNGYIKLPISEGCEYVIAFKHKITYKLNGGKNNKSNPASFVAGKTISLKKPTRVGYKFVAWYTDNALKNKITKVSKTTTLYAKWTPVTYKITYKLNGGKNNKANPKSFKITTKTIKLKAPTKKGYKFVGWYASYKFKTKVFQIKKGSHNNVTLYAKWKKK